MLQLNNNAPETFSVINIIHRVSKKNTTEPGTITLTVVVYDFSNFWYTYYWVNIPPKGGLILQLP